MKKIFIALAVVATLAAFASCSKNCNCKQTVTYQDETGEWDDMDDMGGNATFTQQTKGKCSKLNSESRSSMGGVTMVNKVECEEM